MENKCNGINATGVHSISCNETEGDLDSLFVPLRHFVSTKIGFYPLDEENKPLTTCVKQQSDMSEDSLESSSKANIINKLVMVSLTPYRKGVTLTRDDFENFDYQSVE